ncbi:MAG TPA: homocysteine S-methyltransferase family protein [Acidimicrobiales bacterium]|nr:homocysteine S-methyltransferase family protein [Acidimicrobiales bacterium]
MDRSDVKFAAAAPGLLQRLAEGPVICAEGYLFECERRGYLQAGAYVPEVVLEHPEVITQLHRDFVHAGSDVVEAFTYYAHREKLRAIGREDVLEPLNRQALEIAKHVARESGALFAGNISNTNIYAPDDEVRRKVREMFAEQVAWAVEAGVDYIIAETFAAGEEAVLACEVIKETGLPAVVTFVPDFADAGTLSVGEGWSAAETCKRLEDAGADVVGLNCCLGPRTMLPYLQPIRESVRVPVAALPVPYRTHFGEPFMQALTDPQLGVRPFPVALDPFTCNRFEIADFARIAQAIGVRYLGLCCGAGPHHIRALAEALGRTPPSSRYSADITRHYFFGEEARRLAPVGGRDST